VTFFEVRPKNITETVTFLELVRKNVNRCVQR